MIQPSLPAAGRPVEHGGILASFNNPRMPLA